MARISIYLNFLGKTEEAFTFYKKVFRTDFVGPIARMGDAPTGPGMPEWSATEKLYVMHVELPILPGYSLMGTDVPAFMKDKYKEGTKNTYGTGSFVLVNAGAKPSMPLADMFWGAYYGSLTDKFGIPWMFNFPAKP